MIIKDTINGFIHTYSDSNLMIKKVGTEEVYSEAYDILEFEYEETDIEIIETEL
jgi:hypothetical protein